LLIKGFKKKLHLLINYFKKPMLQEFIIPFLAIGLAELGDKTQLAIFCLASQTKNIFNCYLVLWQHLL